MGGVATTTTATGTRTIARLWQDAVARGLESPAYLVQEGEEWRPVSWTEAAQAVDEIAHGLLALGVRKGDAFAILASTRLEWVLFDFALGLIGAVGAPIYMILEDNLAKLSPAFWQFGIGLLLVLTVLFARRGLLGMAEDAARYFKRKP